jgi:hypothetical protein
MSVKILIVSMLVAMPVKHVPRDHLWSADCVRLSRLYSMGLLTLDETLNAMLRHGCI